MVYSAARVPEGWSRDVGGANKYAGSCFIVNSLLVGYDGNQNVRD